VRPMSGMKLVIAIVQDEDVDALLGGLRDARFGATKIGSSGGFLRSGNSTVLIGVEEGQVDAVLDIIQQHCHRRTQLALPYSPALEPGLLYVPDRFEVEVGGAIVFVQSVDRFERL
jgi:uncharacterized protein YaaQ